MKHIYKLLLAIFLLPLFSNAQSNYKPGYVVNLKGDTVRGYIDYRDWDTNPNSVNFKVNITDTKTEKFTTKEIVFFGVNGLESFQKYSGAISTDDTNINHLSDGRDSSFRIDDTFLRVLQKGKTVALYSYSDNLKLRFFVADAPEFKIVELGYRIYYDLDVVTQTKGRTATENVYIRQLLIIASKHNVITQKLQNKIRGSAYDADDLLKVASEINGISETEFKKNYSSKTKFNWFVGAGANLNTNSTGSLSPYYYAGGRAYTSVLPQASFGVNLFANPNTGRLLFRAEVSVAQSKYKNIYANKTYPYVDFKTSFDELSFSFSPQILYNFYNAENFKIFAGLGATLSIFKYSNSYYGPSVPNPAYNAELTNLFDFNKFDDMFLVKAGVQVGKRWIIYGTYFSNTATTRGGYFQLSSSSKQIGLNYLFE